MKKFGLILPFLLLIGSMAHAAVEDLPLVVKSPNGRLAVKVNLNENQQPIYCVERDGTTIIADSKLGIKGFNKFSLGFAASTLQEINETYTLPHGKRSSFVNHCNELSVDCDNEGTYRDMTIQFRVYDDAIAFRYLIPKGSLSTFTGEETEFNFPLFSQALALEAQHDYSWYYYYHPWNDLTAERGYNEPVLIQHNLQDDEGQTIYTLLSEASHYAQTSGNVVVQGDEPNQLKLRLSSRPGTEASSRMFFPFDSPWRTLIIGTTCDIVESCVINHLNPAADDSDWSWVRPGRVAWNWGGEDRGGTGSIKIAKSYADMAAHLGWEYLLIDDGWEGRINLTELVEYCDKINVGVILWYHNNQFSTAYKAVYDKMKALADIGIKGLKIDFFDNDAQPVIAKYETLLKAAKACRLMLDFHGCTRPTGWERKYPHLMTMEACCGGEYLLDQPHMNPAYHSVNLAVTRNVLGAMDFTPLKLAQRTGSLTHQITWSYNLALWTLFESSWQCMIDCPQNIIDSPIEPVLRLVPTTWDDTKCLELLPNKYATIARRSADNWFVATVSSDSRLAKVPMSFLPEGTSYTAYIYRDGPAATFDVVFEKRTVTSADIININVKKNGGATIVLSQDKDLLANKTVSYEAESYCSSGTKKTDDHCSRRAYMTGYTGNIRAIFHRVKVDEEGRYALTIYYMLPDEQNTAYIQVGNNGDKLYFDFHVRDDYDRSKGLVMGMKTIYVDLKAGYNMVTYGSDSGMAPGLDKISVTPAGESQAVVNSKPQVPAHSDHSIRFVRGQLYVDANQPGDLYLYTNQGIMLERHPLQPGENAIKVAHKGNLIISAQTGTKVYAKKLLIR